MRTQKFTIAGALLVSATVLVLVAAAVSSGGEPVLGEDLADQLGLVRHEEPPAGAELNPPADCVARNGGAMVVEEVADGGFYCVPGASAYDAWETAIRISGRIPSEAEKAETREALEGA